MDSKGSITDGFYVVMEDPGARAVCARANVWFIISVFRRSPAVDNELDLQPESRPFEARHVWQSLEWRYRW